MDVNFGMAPDPQQDPNGFARQKMLAQALMQRGSTSPQGQMSGGQYIAPSPMSYVNQLGNAAMGGMQMGQLQGAQRASNILNGGTGVNPNLFTKIGGLLGGGA